MPQDDIRSRIPGWLADLLAALGLLQPSPAPPPTITLSAPATAFTAPGTLTLEATAGGGPIARVEFYKDGVKIGERFSAPYALPVEVKNAAQAGQYTAKAFTLSAASPPSAPVAVTVDIAPPVVIPPDTTAPSVTLTASPNPLTAAGRITLTATATDDTGVTSVGLVRISPTPRAFPVLTAPPYVWEDPDELTYLDSGTPRTYSATAYDAAYNASPPDLETVAVTIPTPADTTPPTINGVSTPGLTGTTITAEGPQTFEADVADAGGSGLKRVIYYWNDVERPNSRSSTPPFTVNLPFTAADNGTVKIRVRAFDNAGNTKDQLLTLTVAIPTGPALYVEPADPWTAYPWVDGELIVNDAWLDANATLQASGPWAGWWKVTGLSQRHMVQSQRAVTITSKRKVLFSQCNFMGCWGLGTGMAAVGTSSGNTRIWFEDCSIYGAGLNLGNGQSAGGMAFEYSRLLGVSNCNFVRSKGINLANVRGAEQAGDGIFIRYNRMIDIDGRIRDTASPSGYSQSNEKGVGWRRTQAVQINKLEAGTPDGGTTIYLGWNHISSTPYLGPDGVLTAAYIDDTINLYALNMTSNNPAIVERNLIDGAYSHILKTPVPYSGGGILLGDGNGKNQLARVNVTIQTSNYGQSVSAGNYMTIEDGIVVGRGYLDDGSVVNAFDSDDTRLDPVDPDGGAYMRHYGMALADVLPDTRVMRRMKVMWGRPLTTDPARRWDYSVDAGRGTITAPVATRAGQVYKADEDEARNTWLGWKEAAGVVIGRRAP